MGWDGGGEGVGTLSYGVGRFSYDSHNILCCYPSSESSH